MRGAALYKGIYLMPNSQAFHLWDTKQWKELDQHMKELDDKARKLQGEPDVRTVQKEGQ